MASLPPHAAFVPDLAAGSVSRIDHEQRAVGFVGQQVQLAVRSLPDVADALAQIAQQRFAAQLSAVVGEYDALEASYSTSACITASSKSALRLRGEVWASRMPTRSSSGSTQK